MTPAGWPTTLGKDGSDEPFTDIVQGTAGVVLTAIWAGGEHADEIAAGGGEALLAAADRTDAGLDWGMLPGRAVQRPQLLARHRGHRRPRWPWPGPCWTARTSSRPRCRGRSTCSPWARWTTAASSSRTPSRRTTSRVVEPVTYTWCHGPAGTSHLFAALAHAGVSEVAGLRGHRAAPTVPALGPHLGRPAAAAPRLLGQRRPVLRHRRGRGRAARRRPGLRPTRTGGPCCWPRPGTMGDALVERAIRDEDGARWRFIEHRQDPPLLPPGHLVDAGRRRHRRLPAPAGPGPRATGPTHRWSTGRTSGGPSRPGCAPCGRGQRRSRAPDRRAAPTSGWSSASSPAAAST